MRTLLRVRKTALLAASSAILLQEPGCLDSIFMNLVVGARDGLVTTVTGVIEDAFNAHFGLKEEEDGAASGNDLFIRL